MQTFDEFVKMIRSGYFPDANEVISFVNEIGELWWVNYQRYGDEGSKQKDFALDSFNRFNFLMQVLTQRVHAGCVDFGSQTHQIRIALSAIRDAGLLPEEIAALWSEFLRAKN